MKNNLMYGVLGSGTVSTALIWGGIGGEINAILAICSTVITVLLGAISVADGVLNLMIKHNRLKESKKNTDNDNGSDSNTSGDKGT